MKNIFITGTSTEVGKTYVTCGLMKALQQQGFNVLGIKPLASGSVKTFAGLRNSDALQLQKQGSIFLKYETINPFAFEPAIAPHIAAQQANEILSVERLKQGCQSALTMDADFLLIEGVGGWMVPLNQKETMADFVYAMQWPVIMVVGMQLGCLNYALLTANAIRQQGVSLLGWVANFNQPQMACCQENFIALQQWLKAPCLGTISYAQAAEEAFAMNLYLCDILK